MTQNRTRATLKQQILDYIKANDGTNRLDLAAALRTGEANISKVMPELIAEKKVFRSRGLKGFVCFHSSAEQRDIFNELNGKSNPGIVEEYCRNSLVYRFDKLLLAVRKNDSQPNPKGAYKACKDRWQTPVEIFRALDAEFRFGLDAAADYANALYCRYLTEEDDALSCDWHTRGAIFCNPPYSNITPWFKKAAEQCVVQKQVIVMLLPSDTSTGWFRLGLESVDEVRVITGGRLSFISAATGMYGKNGNSKGSLLFIWRPFIRNRCQFTTVDKSDLVHIGTEALREVAA